MALKYVPQKVILKKRYRPLNIDRRILLVGLAAIVLSFFIDVKRFVFIGVFIIANCLILSLDRYVNMPIDIEFSTFASILCTLAYGLKWGIFVAIITKAAAMLYNANIRADHIFMIIGYCFAAFFASVLHSFNVVFIGVTATIITNIYIVFVSKFITNLYPIEIIMYGVSNFVFNFILFIGFSEPILALMRL
jgi:hypothetical protein